MATFRECIHSLCISSANQQMLTEEQASRGGSVSFTFTAPLFTAPPIPTADVRKAAGGGVQLNLAALYLIGKALFGNKKESTSNLGISESTLSMPPAAYLELYLYDTDSMLVSQSSVPVGPAPSGRR